jgi:hypothetical protein
VLRFGTDDPCLSLGQLDTKETAQLSGLSWKQTVRLAQYTASKEAARQIEHQVLVLVHPGYITVDHIEEDTERQFFFWGNGSS